MEILHLIALLYHKNRSWLRPRAAIAYRLRWLGVGRRFGFLAGSAEKMREAKKATPY